ncbi:MAG: hypothetical protein ABFS32_02145 [Bacteroidota bacterium]
MKLLFSILSMALAISFANAQVLPADTIFSFQDAINNGKLKLGTDTLVSYIESEAIRDKISDNVRTIEFNNNQYKITTYNKAAGSEDITKVEAILDGKDLHILRFYLKSKNDSAFAQYKNAMIKGWLQIPQQEKKNISYAFEGNTFLSDGNTPWLIGLLELKENQTIVIPVFHLFSNSLRWKTYEVLGEEAITINDISFSCWKVDAGPLGPPGFNAFHWYTKNTGKLLRVVLSKEGETAMYVSELKNIQ